MNYLIFKSRVIQAIREFFFEANYLEIQSPIRLKAPALEDYIDAVDAGVTYGEKMFLRTSPELHLKRFIADNHQCGGNKVFQVGSCFRKGEIGSQHQEEFTMLEWYRTEAGYRNILDDTKKLLVNIVKKLNLKVVTFRDHKIDISADWEVITVADAFLKWAPMTVTEAIEQDVFEEIIGKFVEPNLGNVVPTVLIDYPISQAALSKQSVNNPLVAERWELYIAGLELANCYTELTDYDEQLKRFQETAKLRANDNREVYPIDQAFLDCLHRLPECGGIALGVERLCMVLANCNDIIKFKL